MVLIVSILQCTSLLGISLPNGTVDTLSNSDNAAADSTWIVAVKALADYFSWCVEAKSVTVGDAEDVMVSFCNIQALFGTSVLE